MILSTNRRPVFCGRDLWHQRCTCRSKWYKWVSRDLYDSCFIRQL